MSREKKLKKKKKFRFKKFFIFMLFLAIIITVILNVFSFKIKNINVTGNKIYTDTQIIEKAKLSNYPSFLTTSSILMEIKLEKDPLIKKAVVKKSFWAVINIKITEYQSYFITNKNVLVLEGGRTVKMKDLSVDVEAPLLTSDLTTVIYNKLLKAFSKIDPSIITEISEIEYTPSALDKGRFLFLMTDGNYAYVTLINIKSINYYSKIVTQLAGQKGIINFDSYRSGDAGITIDILN